MGTLALICLKVEEISTLLTNPRTLGLVEAWQDLEVRAREEEVKNWSPLSRARAREEVSSSPRTLGLVEV